MTRPSRRPNPMPRSDADDGRTVSLAGRGCYDLLMSDPALQATLEQRISDIGLDRTLEASPTATIKPSRGARIQTDQDPARLPRISLAAARPGPPSSSDERAHTTDLELIELLGEGGMGRVHAAFQRSLRREVAIKTLRNQGDNTQVVALLREAIYTGALEHPGVVPILSLIHI